MLKTVIFDLGQTVTCKKNRGSTRETQKKNRILTVQGVFSFTHASNTIY